MEFLSTLISSNFSNALCTTLVHSIWQISLVGILLFLFRNVIDKNAHGLRYWSGLIALFTSIILCVGTFISTYIQNLALSASHYILNAPATLNEVTSQSSQSGLLESSFYQLAAYQDLIVVLWFAGFCFLILKFVFGINQTRIIKLSATPFKDERIVQIFESLMSKMKIAKQVGIAESNKINTAIVAGFWKPMILFPISMVNQLSTDELQAIIAHELAHIKRNDFIVNVFQTLAELMLYFHPVIWWISNIINEEREICCDDLALGITENNHAYAKALVKLQEFRFANTLPLVLAFSGNRNEFKNRILRILNQPLGKQLNKERMIAIIAMLVFALAFRFTDDVVHSPELETCSVIECISLCEEIAKDSEAEIQIVLITEDGHSHKNLNCESRSKSTFQRPEKEKMIRTIIMRNDNQKKINAQAMITDTVPYNTKSKLKFYSANKKELIDSFISQRGELLYLNIDSILNSIPRNLEYNKLDSIYMHAYQDHIFEDLIEKKELKDFLKLKEIQVFADQFDMEKLLEENEFDLVYPDYREQLFDESKLKFKFLEKEKMDLLKNYQCLPKFDCSKSELFKDDLSTNIARELYKDGYIDYGDEFKVEITKKHFKINGEKQPSNIKNKYAKIFEKNLGFEINNESKIVIESSLEKTNNIFKSI